MEVWCATSDIDIAPDDCCDPERCSDECCANAICGPDCCPHCPEYAEPDSESEPSA